MSQQYPGGFITKSPPALNPAMGNAAPGVWTMDQVTQAIKNGTWPAYDPYFENVTLLLHGNGTNGAQNNTFIDGSSNAFTITRNGNTTQGTFSPYGSNWSNYFDGTGDYLTVPDNAAFDLGSGDFTIEAWLYITSGNSVGVSGAGWISQWSSGSTQAWYFGTTNGNTFVLGYTTNGSTVNVISSGYVVTTSLNQWVHFAVSKSGTSVKLFVNGVQTGSTGTLSGTIYNSSDVVTLGYNQGAGAGWELFGYMSNARVVKGTAVYTANFTPPTAPLTAITNTSLLTCQSNRFIDNSSNAFAITANGNTSVQAFSPFAPTAAYSTSVVGGSGYFDGTGDYLSAANNAAFDFGTGSFTIEAWIYTGTKVNYQSIIGSWDGSSEAWYFHTNSSGTITYGIQTNVVYTGSAQVCDNAWHHVAIVRNGASDLRLYVDGVLDNSQTNSTNIDTNAEVRIGSLSSGATRFFTGYISNLRVVKGTAVYTAAFTPPTAPLTAITNTAILCNFTNAGIIDNAMMNDLETVGNAQISTTQSKFGGSSMYFDGTGDSANTIASPNLSFSSGNFTVEFWMYTNDTAADVISQRPSGGYGPFGIYIGSSQTIEGYVSTTGSSWVFTGSRSFTNNQWTHVALVRDGSTVYLYVDGTRSTGGNVSTNSLMTDTTNPLRIGGNVGNGDFNGYIDDLRITKGVARYTANFTPQTSQWQDR
jgi:hypothetical protein